MSVERETVYEVYLDSGNGTQHEFLGFQSYEEAEEFCIDERWVFVDENGFEWNLVIKEETHTIITHNVVCSIICDESKLELCTFANGDRAFMFYYKGELKHTQRITTNMVNPISHMGTVLLEMMDRNEEGEFDK